VIIDDEHRERDLADAATYGLCPCGRPYRARLDRDDEGRPTRSYAACDVGHDMDDWLSA
jgi:hypothetical protein